MTKYIIIGGTHHNTLGLIESLYEVGIKPYVIIYNEIKHNSYIEHSNWYEKFWMFSNKEDVIECMLDECKSEDGKSIVISSADVATCLLDEYFDELYPYFVLPLSNQKGGVSRLMNKDDMGDLATKIGLTIPKKYVIENGVIPEEIEYPCITKAISSVEGSKFDMAICNNHNDLYLFINGKERCKKLAVQRFIDKSYEFQLLGVSLNFGENIVITGRTHIDRPHGVDNTFFLRFQKCEIELNDTISKCEEFIRATKYQGPFSIEFLKGKDGNIYFMEMNFRNDGNAICQTAAGVNIPYIWYLYGIGGDWKKVVEDSKIRTIHLIPEIQQIKFWVLGEISLKELVNEFKLADKWITYFKNDKKPFFWLIINRVRGVFSQRI